MRTDLRLRNYSSATVRTYMAHADLFARHFGRSPTRLGPDHIRSYLLHVRDEQGCSWSWWRQAVSALRFLYGTTLGRRDVIPQIPYPRRERRLPVVLTTSEVERLIKAAPSVKHKVILMTIYSAGLRISEALHLTKGDIDPAAMLIHVRHGKGRRDRIVPLSPALMHGLRQYMRLNRTESPWLFPGQDPLRPLTSATVERMTSKARERANIDKHATPRSLRHSFATHHLETGTDIRTIQELLGHAHINSTLVYLHLSRRFISSVPSPLDQLDVELAPIQLAFAGF